MVGQALIKLRVIMQVGKCNFPNPNYPVREQNAQARFFRWLPSGHDKFGYCPGFCQVGKLMFLHFRGVDYALDG
jgi:hypothetical protein